MKFCTFKHGSRVSCGVVVDHDRIVNLSGLLDIQTDRGLDAIVELLAETPAQLDGLAAAAREADSSHQLSSSEVEWLPPILKPGKILGVAINNIIGQSLAHRPFEKPAFFMKPRTSLVGHNAPVVVRSDFGVTHPEPELAVVVGTGGKNIAEGDALDHVLGFTIINDITSPGLKERDSLEIIIPELPGNPRSGYQDLLSWRQVYDDDHARSVYLTYHTMSKGTDTFGPMGPWIVTKDEIPDPNNLSINSFSGDEPVFEDSTANLTFSVEQIISHVSQYQTLEPGDIIHCGTSMKPAPDSRFRTITDWDLTQIDAPMSIEIEGIGRLVNPVEVQRPND